MSCSEFITGLLRLRPVPVPSPGGPQSADGTAKRRGLLEAPVLVSCTGVDGTAWLFQHPEPRGPVEWKADLCLQDDPVCLHGLGGVSGVDDGRILSRRPVVDRLIHTGHTGHTPSDRSPPPWHRPHGHTRAGSAPKPPSPASPA